MLSRAPFIFKKRSYVNVSEKERTKALSVARDLCERMRDDLKWGDVYAKTRPDSFLRIRYEDLAEHTTDVMGKIYDFLGLHMPEEAQSRIVNMTSAGRDGLPLGTLRKNSTATAHAWRSKVSKSFHLDLIHACGDVIETLDYNLQL